METECEITECEIYMEGTVGFYNFKITADNICAVWQTSTIEVLTDSKK